MNMKKLLTILFALMMIGNLSFGAGNYFVWTGLGSPTLGWQDPLNWTRTVDFCEPAPVIPSAWPGELPANDGDVVIFNNSTVNIVANIPSVTLGRLEVTFLPNTSAGTFTFLNGAVDGSVITMRGLTPSLSGCGFLYVVMINDNCFLDLNQFAAPNRVKLVCKPGANFWQKNGSFFSPADYLLCDGQQGFVLQADATRHAEYVQQETNGQLVKGWVQYVFDDGKYHYFSPPVTSVWPAAGDPEFSTQFCRKHNSICVFDGDYFRKFQNGIGWDSWMGQCGPIVSNPLINFEPGRGYEYYGNNLNNPGGLYEIYGTLHSGAPAVTLPINTLGWNFVGNPFPSAITFSEAGGPQTAGPGWSWNYLATDPVAYWWDNVLNAYRYWDWFLKIGNGPNDPPRTNVPRSQGFFVHVSFLSPGTPGGSDVSVGNLARVFRETRNIGKSVVANNMMLTLNDASGTIDDAVINFREDANGTEFNHLLDVYKLFNDITNVSQLYLKTTDNVDVALKTLKLENGNTMYPLYLKVISTGTYSINAQNLSTFAANTGISLKDNKTNVTVDLKVNPVYTFTATAGDDDARFSLLFSDVLGINNLDNNAFKVYSFDNSIYIQNNDLKSATGTVWVYDMIGKQMIQEKLSSDAITRINTNLNTGFYIVSVKTDKGVYNQKVYIN